jgi:hypothetical protein
VLTLPGVEQTFYGAGSGAGSGAGTSVVGAAVGLGAAGTTVEDPPLDDLGTVVDGLPATPARSAADVDLLHGSGMTFRLVVIRPGVANGCKRESDR